MAVVASGVSVVNLHGTKLTFMSNATILAAPPNNIVRVFVVEVTVDRNDPKMPTIDQLENRIGEGPQWLDGVSHVSVRYDGNKPPPV